MAKVNAAPPIVLSLLTAITGIILIVIGSIVVNRVYFLHDVWTQIYVISILSIGLGIFTLIIAVGLIYVLIRQLPALTLLFSSLIILCAIFGLVLAVILLVGRSNLRRKAYDDVDTLISQYSLKYHEPRSNAFLALIHQTFECCGVEEVTDWKNSTLGGSSTPDSCCRDVKPGCGQGTLRVESNIYLRGCAEPIFTFLQSKYKMLVGINFAVMALAFLTAVAGFLFERHIRQQYQLM